MSTYIIDTSLSTNRFDKEVRFAELAEYMKLLSASGVDLFEVSSSILSYFPNDADMSNIILRIRGEDDLSAADEYRPGFVTVTQELFEHIGRISDIPVFAEIAATEKTDFDKVDIYLAKIPRDRLHAVTFRGSFSSDVNLLRSFLMRATSKYGKPINIFPTDEKTNAVSVCINAEKFYSEFVTVCYGSTERNCAELYDFCCSRNVINMHFPSAQYSNCFSAARSLYRLIFSREPVSIQQLRTPGRYLPTAIYETNCPYNSEIERMNADMFYASCAGRSENINMKIEAHEGAPDKLIRSILGAPPDPKKKKN